MTDNQLLKRVKFWQRALDDLGVSHFALTVEVVDEPQGKRSAEASVWTSTDYDTCSMEFRADFIFEHGDEPDGTLDKTIIHEWLHVAFRDYNHSVLSVRDLLGEPTKSMWLDRVDHEEEGLIERLARAIYVRHIAEVVF